MKQLSIVLALLALTFIILIVRYYFLKRKISKQISREIYKYLPPPYDIGQITLDVRNRPLNTDKKRMG